MNTNRDFRVGVDIGGTFTDIVFLADDGTLHIRKVSSTDDDYARAIAKGLREVFKETELTGNRIAEVLHGTTVASNAILEMTGARTGLITTRRVPGRPRATHLTHAEALRHRVGKNHRRSYPDTSGPKLPSG